MTTKNEQYSKMPTDKLQVNMGKMFLSLIIFLAIAAFGTIAFSAQDALWFLPGFTQRPVYVIVFHDGQRTQYYPGTDGYDLLANAVRDTLNSGVKRLSGMGFSQASLDDAYHKYVTVEAYFDPPAKLHTYFDTGLTNMALFPITGRDSDMAVVFLGENGIYQANSPIVKNYSSIQNAVKQLGFIPTP